LPLAATGEVGKRGAGQADRVDALVLVETLVLGGEDGVLEMGGHLRDAHYVTTFLTELANEVAVRCINAERDPRPIVGQRIQGRKFRPGEEGHRRERGETEDGEREQRCDRIQDPAHG